MRIFRPDFIPPFYGVYCILAGYLLPVQNPIFPTVITVVPAVAFLIVLSTSYGVRFFSQGNMHLDIAISVSLMLVTVCFLVGSGICLQVYHKSPPPIFYVWCTASMLIMCIFAHLLDKHLNIKS